MASDKRFRNVASFQVLTPSDDAQLGWMKFRPSWHTDLEAWHCEWTSQDQRSSHRKLINAAYAEDVWNRFRHLDTCETTWLEGVK